MKKYLNNLPEQIRNLIYLARDVAADRRMHAYLVGGFVRDLILGVPNFDLDIVIEGNGLEFASEFARRLNVRLIKHHRFGTATLITPDKMKFDIATARSEVYPKPAILPEVYSGTIKEDLARRDFTINAMALDLAPDNFGGLVDFYHGESDLKNKRIRILHNLSFIDDPTRILRAVRFEQRFNFKIEPQSLILAKEAAGLGMLLQVGPHRLRDELILILKESAAIACILRLKELAGLGFIHPDLKLQKSKLEYLAAIEDEVIWFKKNFSHRRSLDVWLMYFTGLLDGLGEKEIEHICKNFGLTKGDFKRIISYYKFSSSLAERLSKKDLSPSRVYRYLEPLSFEVILLIRAKYRNRFLKLHIEQFFKCYNIMRLGISGKDLIRLGLTPSPDYKRMLTRLLYLHLDGKVNTSAEQLEWISRHLKSK